MIVYATDEDIAIRAPADYLALCPSDQLLASGTDGLFLASDLWTLRSPSVDFAGSGVLPGQVIRLGGAAVAGAHGELYVIAVIGSGGLTLRRVGQAPGVGRPPAPLSGLSGVEFVVRTLAPQIDRASYDLNHRFGIDEAVTGRRSADLRDPRSLTDATVLTVLSRRYFDQARRFAGNADGPEDWYGVKARATKIELDDLLDRLVLRWNSLTDPSRSSPTTRFSTRLSR